MRQRVISVKGLGKRYRIGLKEQEHDTLASQITSIISSPFRNFNRIRQLSKFKTNESSEDIIWALQTVSFEVNKGEVLGVIGKNGAGKSTLLKILSRITKPSEGRATIEGRVASLLEVGTGFHFELSGRENIYLNGTLLGMKKTEIDQKLDEIIDFSGIEKFIDTPVKRYSSGMTVRLAFAIAAHLDPEILIIDEVLAVGDTEFQKKCLGKMKEVTGEGRTVLFVSHNLSAVSSICDRLILLDEGKKVFDGGVEEGIGRYLQLGNQQKDNIVDLSADTSHYGPRTFSQFVNARLTNDKNEEAYNFIVGEEIRVTLDLELTTAVSDLELGFTITDMKLSKLHTFIGEWEGCTTSYDKGKHRIECRIPNLKLFPGNYGITFWSKKKSYVVDDQVEMGIRFEVDWNDITGFKPDFDRYPDKGVFRRSNWKVTSGHNDL